MFPQKTPMRNCLNRNSFGYTGNALGCFYIFRSRQPPTTNAVAIWYTIGGIVDWLDLSDYIQRQAILRKL